MAAINALLPVNLGRYSIKSVKRSIFKSCICQNSSAAAQATDDEEFRVLDLKGVKKVQAVRRRHVPKNIFPPRADSMPTDQDWTNVWPGPRTFHPASVPLPVRQGINKLGAAPGKVANVELMKIPNFLHLTPPAIKKHCKALKQFCTPWPKALSTDAECTKHFPLEVIQTDYVHSSPSIRNPLSRIVTIKFPLSRLELDDHARDKFLRLVGERYDEKTGLVTIVTDKCPLKQQNHDYAMYLLTALYFESWTYEPWEKEKSQDDLEYFDWENSKSKENIKFLFNATSQNFDNSEEVLNYKKSVTALFDEGENDYNLEKYKKSALKVLHPDLSEI